MTDKDQSPLSAVATADPIRAALHELVDLKTIKEQCDDFRGIHPDKEVEYWKAYHDYQRRQPLAWAAAREALRVSPQTTCKADRAMAASHGSLPDCMIGPSEPCAAYQYLEQENQRLREASSSNPQESVDAEKVQAIYNRLAKPVSSASFARDDGYNQGIWDFAQAMVKEGLIR